jgi:hypothetical protein
VIVISDDDDDDDYDDDIAILGDDDVIEILDDEDEPSTKNTPQDNCNMIISADGTSIPVITVTSIPASGDRRNFCVVGDVDVKVPGQLKSEQQHGAEQHLVVQESAASHITALNTGGDASRLASISGANSFGSSAEDSKPLCSASSLSNSDQSSGSAVGSSAEDSKPLCSASSLSNSDQSSGSAVGSSAKDSKPLCSASSLSNSDQSPGSAVATGDCLLKSCLMQDSPQGRHPNTDGVSAVQQISSHVSFLSFLINFCRTEHSK